MAPPSGYQLVFEDNFNGTILDTTKWYTRGNIADIKVENGYVKIGPSSCGIESGKSNYSSKYAFKYPAYVETRAKLAGTGNENSYASQLWLFEEGVTNKDEIDILENSSGPITLIGNKGRDKMNTTIHCPSVGYSIGKTKDTNIDLSLDYHLYSVLWTKDYVKVYFDNVEWTTIYPSATVCIPPNLMYFVLTLCRKWDPTDPGQCWPATDKATINAYMYIDYVKVYKPGVVVCPTPGISMVFQ